MSAVAMVPYAAPDAQPGHGGYSPQDRLSRATDVTVAQSGHAGRATRRYAAAGVLPGITAGQYRADLQHANIPAAVHVDGARITVTVGTLGDITTALDAITDRPWRDQIIDREPDRVVIRTPTGPVTVTSRIEPGDVAVYDPQDPTGLTLAWRTRADDRHVIVVLTVHPHEETPYAHCHDEDDDQLVDIDLTDLRITARCARTEVA
jgi:hypothetical protein